MRPINKCIKILIAVAAMVAPIASATPIIDSMQWNLRVFNDCPTSIVSTGGTFPGYLWIEDNRLGCSGFANLHNWHLAIGGVEAVFNNADDFTLSATLRLSGNAESEAGLQIAPWWAQNVDGKFNVRSTDGEIACFGGRLPFFSFTSTFGLHYVGEMIRLTMVYTSNDLSQADPAEIEYIVDYNGITYSSGNLDFDEGNPAEDPPYGLWGIMNDARVGSYFQVFLQPGNDNTVAVAEWWDIEYEAFSIPTEDRSWSEVKSLY